MPDLTSEQREAIERRHVSIALSAGAGCGKTHVLTERFLSHLDPDAADAARLGQLIAITFTDAAAREMRSRIRSACHERLNHPETQEPADAKWFRLVRELDTARISTIHAFCTALLRNHAAEAGLDPTFDVLEQSQADVLRLEVMDDVLRGRLEARDDDTLELAAAFGLPRLKDQIAALISRRHEAAFRCWLAATPDELAAKSAAMVAAWRSRYDGEGFQNCVAEIAGEAPIDDILEMLRSVEPAKPLFKEAKQSLLQLLPKLKSGTVTREDIERICEFARLKTAAGPYICTAKDWGDDKETCQRYGKLCESLRKCIDSHTLLPWNEAAAEEAALLGLKLLRLAGDVVDEYQRRKNALGKLDFDDQLALAHRLLSDPKNSELRKELSGDLQLLLVDEFQDTDPLQIDLVKTICGEGFDAGRLFFVGDFKQSIYRFRGAQPPEFLNLRGQIPDEGRLHLTLNFRSRPGILNFVNALFCDEFEEYDRLRPHRTGENSQPAVEFLWTLTPYKNTNETGAREKARREEARAIARRLAALIDPRSDVQPIVDKDTGKLRRVQPGDVAILFRALSDVRLYEEALREQGLDYYLVGGHAFYAQQEIYDVLNLLRAVASTADEVSLAGALRSPFFALADETLFWLVESARSADFSPSDTASSTDFSPSASANGLKSVLRIGSLNAGLMAQRLPPQLSPEERAKAAAAADTLCALRAAKDRVPIVALLVDALERTGYDAVLLGEFLGERKLANLQKLIEQARGADSAGVDLGGFITQLAEFVARPPQEPLASTCPETADVIRLMTIHRAKGLEFPLVVVPDLDRPPILKPPVAALDLELGPLVGRASDEEREETATGMSLFAAREKVEELEERKRLLYVACTRAADYLILSSSLESYEIPKSDWMKLLAQRFDLEGGQLHGKLPPDYDAPSVRVTIEKPGDRQPAGKSRGPDLLKLLEEAHQLAADGRGVVPPGVAPIPVDHAARRQFSFSRLSGQLISTDAPSVLSMTPSALAPATAPTIDPRGLGTLVHDVLARLDFRGDDDIADWCEHLASQHVLLNAEQAARQAREMLERFAASSRFGQLRDATAFHRELEFLLAWPSTGVAGVEPSPSPQVANDWGLADARRQRPHGSSRYFHGFIDCLYQDSNGGWHLIDYKTNDVAATEVARLAQQYELQMHVYAMAAERALGQPPIELALHFLRPGVEHAFPWNDAARDRAIEPVNKAIAAANCASTSVQERLTN